MAGHKLITNTNSSPGAAEKNTTLRAATGRESDEEWEKYIRFLKDPTNWGGEEEIVILASMFHVTIKTVNRLGHVYVRHPWFGEPVGEFVLGWDLGQGNGLHYMATELISDPTNSYALNVTRQEHDAIINLDGIMASAKDELRKEGVFDAVQKTEEEKIKKSSEHGPKGGKTTLVEIAKVTHPPANPTSRQITPYNIYSWNAYGQQTRAFLKNAKKATIIALQEAKFTDLIANIFPKNTSSHFSCVNVSKNWNESAGTTDIKNHGLQTVFNRKILQEVKTKRFIIPGKGGSDHRGRDGTMFMTLFKRIDDGNESYCLFTNVHFGHNPLQKKDTHGRLATRKRVTASLLQGLTAKEALDEVIIQQNEFYQKLTAVEKKALVCNIVAGDHNEVGLEIAKGAPGFNMQTTMSTFKNCVEPNHIATWDARHGPTNVFDHIFVAVPPYQDLESTDVKVHRNAYNSDHCPISVKVDVKLFHEKSAKI